MYLKVKRIKIKAEKFGTMVSCVGFRKLPWICKQPSLEGESPLSNGFHQVEENFESTLQ